MSAEHKEIITRFRGGRLLITLIRTMSDMKAITSYLEYVQDRIGKKKK